MTADIRTAAQREAERRWPDHMGKEGDDSPIWLDYSEDRANFVENAIWGAKRVTPTREQIAIALAKQKAREWDSTSGVMHLAAIHSEYFNADAVLALMAGLAEGGLQ